MLEILVVMFTEQSARIYDKLRMSIVGNGLGLSMGPGPYGLPVGLPMKIPAKTLTCRSRLPVATGP